VSVLFSECSGLFLELPCHWPQAGAHLDVSSSDTCPSSLSGSLSPSSINSCCGGRSRLCGCVIQGHGPVPTPTATLDPRSGSESRHRPRRWQGTIELLRG
jgi:hypothetical protein